MSISHVGHAILNSPSKKLHLKNVLHVPPAKHNLVSVHRFTKDNDVFSSFTRGIFMLRIGQRGKFFLKGDAREVSTL